VKHVVIRTLLNRGR